MFGATPRAMSRRGLLRGAAIGAAGVIAGAAFGETPLVFRPEPLPRGALAKAPATTLTGGVRPALLARARAALAQHGGKVRYHDLIAIADFSRASSLPRFHLVDMMNGRTQTLLVAHGRGSDPDHSGFVQRFSNEMNSAASSRGAFVTGDEYIGKHGRSRRLIGLDPTNDNAEPRAVVVHAAWYVGPDMVRDHGKLGRSEGCFAVSDSDLDHVLGRLGAGRMIYADKS